MKAFLDTNVFDWLLANETALGTLKNAAAHGALTVIASPEAAVEVRRTPNEIKRRNLEAVLSLVLPLRPTRLPRLGAMRLGLGVFSSDVVWDLHDEVASVPGANRLDPVHLLNAKAEHCEVFVTNDRELLKKATRLRALMGVDVIAPAELIVRITAHPLQCR